MAQTGTPPREIITAKGLVQVSDTGELEQVVESVLSRSAKEVEAYRSGKTKLMGYFVGQVMRETQGQANPQIVNQILRSKLDA